MKTLCVTSRSCSVLLDPEGMYEAREKRELFLNGERLGEECRSIWSLFGLEPDTEYIIESLTEQGERETLTVHTKRETCTLDVRNFGAKGDGETEDTAMLQAAILCCPENGRVLVPPGDYVTGPLFLKSHMTLEIADGAALRLLTDRLRFPILPGDTPADNQDGEILLGMFEGCATDGFAGALNGIDLTDTAIIGEGVIDGRAQESDWWIRPKEIRIASRGNLLYTQRCKGMLIQGLTFMNSPSWNLHPSYSEDLDFIDIRIRPLVGHGDFRRRRLYSHQKRKDRTGPEIQAPLRNYRDRLVRAAGRTWGRDHRQRDGGRREKGSCASLLYEGKRSGTAGQNTAGPR